MQPLFDKLSDAIAIGDADTLDLLAEISRVADHQLRFLESPATSK
jgi:hypothetical protein